MRAFVGLAGRVVAVRLCAHLGTRKARLGNVSGCAPCSGTPTLRARVFDCGRHGSSRCHLRFQFRAAEALRVLWTQQTNTFHEERWKSEREREWKALLFWAQAAHSAKAATRDTAHWTPQRPLWAIVPDRPGHWEETRRKWSEYAGIVASCGFPLAAAVQNGATPSDGVPLCSGSAIAESVIGNTVPVVKGKASARGTPPLIPHG